MSTSLEMVKDMIILYNHKHMKVTMSHILVADMVLLDNMSNKVSVIGLFNAVNIPSDKESIVVRFAVTAQLVFDEMPEDTVKVELALVKPSGSVEKSLTMSFQKSDFPDVSEGSQNLPLIVNFNAVEFTEIGTYNIKVTVNGEAPNVSQVGSFEARKLTEKKQTLNSVIY